MFLIAAACAFALTASGCGNSTAHSTIPVPAPVKHAAVAKKPPPPTLKQLVADTKSGVIRIEADTCDGQSIGTGFLLGPRLVATVEHVVAGAGSIKLKQGRHVVGRGRVIGEDASRDVALVRTSRDIEGYTFKLAGHTPSLGDDVAALGFPLGLPLSVTKGSVSGTARTIPIEGVRRRSLVQTDAAVSPGNSGGPLLSLENGDVVGLVDLDATGEDGIAFAVSSRVAGPLLEAWQVAPQPVAASECATSEPDIAATGPDTGSEPTDTGTDTYYGRFFSIDYPTGWTITSDDEKKAWGYDTTIESPDDDTLKLTVDVTPNVGSSDPMELAQPVIDALRKQSGYNEIDLTRETFNGYDAVHWQFQVREHGQLLEKENEMFVDDNGSGVAILSQAGADFYPDLIDSFAQLRATYMAASE